MGDDDIDDDILQLLSRPSSANTSKRRKSRKKVTFSNASVLNDVNDDKRSHTVSALPFANNSNISSNEYNDRHPIQSTSLSLESTKDSTTDLVNDGDKADDILPSFSRSKRVVDQSYNAHSIDDINELFQINPTK